MEVLKEESEKWAIFIFHQGKYSLSVSSMVITPLDSLFLIPLSCPSMSQRDIAHTFIGNM